MGNTNHSYRCEKCGVIMVNVGYGRKYCDDCRKAQKQSARTKYETKLRTKHPEMFQSKPRGVYQIGTISPETIRQHAQTRATKSDALLLEKCRVADWLGISYGMLMIKGPEKVAELTRQYYEAMKTA